MQTLEGGQFYMKKIFYTIVSVVSGILFVFFIYSVIIVWQARKATPTIFKNLKNNGQLQLTLEDFPDGWLDDLLKVEDPSFYHHNGVDLSTPGAGMTTITQGMVKYLYFKNFRPGVAKLRQSLIARFAVNALIPKDEQLLVFVNTVWLGTHNGTPVHGFGEAADVYYNKSFNDVTHDEYLALVAMVIAPFRFHIENQPEGNADRVYRIKSLLSGEYQPSGLMDLYYDH